MGGAGPGIPQLMAVKLQFHHILGPAGLNLPLCSGLKAKEGPTLAS